MGPGVVLYMALFQWLWSVKNWMYGPLRRDSGLVTWLLLIVSIAYFREPFYAFICSTILGVSYLLVWLKILKGRPWLSQYGKIASYFNKTKFFAWIFFYYLFFAGVFWCWCAYGFYFLSRM